MNFKEEVQSMKFSEIMQAMIDGLRKQHIHVNMTTFGTYSRLDGNNTCIGCAATNMICELSGKVFTKDNIDDRRLRAEFIGVDGQFLQYFENAIDYLRKTETENYDDYAERANIKVIPTEYRENIYCLPMLSTYRYEDDLPQWQELCNEIKEAGY